MTPLTRDKWHTDPISVYCMCAFGVLLFHRSLVAYSRKALALTVDKFLDPFESAV
jgi:hypothetical protein